MFYINKQDNNTHIMQVDVVVVIAAVPQNYIDYQQKFNFLRHV